MKRYAIWIIIGVIFVLACIGIKSLHSLHYHRVVRVSNDLSSALNFAHLEAVKRGVSVSVSAINPQDWGKGWRVLDDETGEQLLCNTILPQGVMLIANQAMIRYNAQGTLNGAPLTISIEPDRCLWSAKRIVSVFVSGRLSIEKTTCSGV